MKKKIGTVNMTFKDAYTLNIIPHLNVDFRYTRSKYGNRVSNAQTDSNGKLSFTGLYYGYYNFNTSLANYLAHSASFKLDSETLNLDYFVVPDKKEAMIIRLNVEKSSYDVDLMLHIKSKNGNQCTVSPVNKYCAYAQYKSDIGKNQNGIESIALKKTTVSYYMVVAVRNDNNAGVSGGNCPATMCQSTSINWFTDLSTFTPMHNNRILRAAREEMKTKLTKKEIEPVEDFDWKSVTIPQDSVDLTGVKQTGAGNFMSNYKYWALYCFTGFGAKSVHYVNKYSNTLPVVTTCEPFYPDSNEYSLKNLETAVNNA